MTFQTLNPATGELIEAYPGISDSVLDGCLDTAAAVAPDWAAREIGARCELLRACSDRLLARRDELAAVITLEMGKLRSEALGEIEKCALVCRHYAEHAPAMLADDRVAMDSGTAAVAYQPLGTVFAIMPWNFPFWQVFRFAAPALAAGNTGLLKHAPNVPRCGLAIASVFQEAGVPEGVFQNLFVSVEQASAIIGDRRVAAVTLTGSERAGRAVAAQAGKHLKKAVFELGGSDPVIVLDDADLEKTVSQAVTSRYMNAGQSCIAAKRFIVTPGIADAFLDLLQESVVRLRTGDPDDEATTLAPMARADLRENLDKQVRASLAKGATCVTGCGPVEGPGFFYKPSVITDIEPGQPAFGEELFGPVASVFRVANEAEAVRLANATRFGLGSSIWTADQERGAALARQVEAGCCFVNGMVASDPRLPFGGIKASGYGRELSVQGIREFVNIKSLWIR